MGTGQRDLGPTQALAHRDDVALDPDAVLIPLSGHLLLCGQHTLEPAEVDQDVPRIATLLDDPGDDVPLASGALPIGLLVLRIAQSLQEHLLGRGAGTPADFGRR